MNIIFQNYHKHTQGTNPRIADSVVSNYDYFKRACELGHGIISIMEHGWQGRYIEGYELSQKCINKTDCELCNSCKSPKNCSCYKHLIFVSGVEAYWVKDRTEKDRSNCHIYIGAINERGRRAINAILSEANISGFYGTARLDEDLILSLPSEDVIVTTACIAFWKYDDVVDFVLKLNNHFKNFFLEVQYHNTESQKVLNEKIKKISHKYNIPMIMGCDSHYIYPEDSVERDNYILSRGIKYEDEEGWYLDYPDGNEAYRRFKEQGVLSEEEIISCMNNTNIFLSVEEYNCDCFNKEIKMPTIFKELSKDEIQDKFEKLVWSKWEDEKKNIPQDKWEVYESEISKEIKIVKDVQHADYFLDDYYIMKRGKEMGGVLTPSGRGSAVSFYINKLLGFTKVDRIAAKVKMYPERFMSATRMLQAKTLADIDMNESNPEVFLKAQEEIFGVGHSYPMIAYGTLKPKAAWKMFARAKGIDFDTSNKISSQIDRYEQELKHTSEDEKYNISIYDYIDKEYWDIFEESKKYQGVIDSFSIHPCSSLLYSGDIPSEIGLIKIKDNLCCLMDGHWAEDYKFLKNDHLKVVVVKLIDRVFKSIGMDMFDVNTLLKLCENNKPVWDIYKKSLTMGINQVEQKSTKGRVAKYAPKNISELCAFVAAIRPGFKSMYPIFEKRAEFSYGIKSLDELIQTDEMDKSFILYQEIQMAVLNYAGIPMSECYTVIKNIAKKRVDKVLAYKNQFLSGFTQKMIDVEHQTEENAEKLSHKIWQIIEDSSRYSFNACLSGGTKFLVLNESDFKYGKTIKELYEEKNTDFIQKNGYGFLYSIDKDKKIVQNKIVDIRYSGIQKTYLITTSTNRRIRVTGNHKFPTTNGVKYCDELTLEDFLYIIRGGSLYIEKICEIIPSITEDVYDVEMEAPNHNFAIDNGIITSNSHSYCVAIDSLYGAYLKATYPVQFYTEFLKLLEENGEKDRFVEAKEEAQDGFGIKFPSFKFGQDNRNIVGYPEKKEITTSLASIKGFGQNVADELYCLNDKKYASFVDLLYSLAETTINKTQIRLLIEIDYFSDFGKTKDLLSLYDFFEFLKYGMAKTISKDKIIDGIKESIIRRNSKETEKTYKELNVFKILSEYNDFLSCKNDEDFSIIEKIKKQQEILGYISLTTNSETDRQKLLITEIVKLISKKTNKVWAYKIHTMSIGTGKKAEILISPELYGKKEIKIYDIIYVNTRSLKKKTYNDKSNWFLFDYTVLNI